MNKQDELEALKQARTAFYDDGANLNQMVLDGKILPYRKMAVESGDYNVNVHVINAAIDALESEIARESKTAPKTQEKCKECGTPLTPSDIKATARVGYCYDCAS